MSCGVGADYAFFKFLDTSGWGNKGFVFLLGLLSVQWVMVGVI